MTKSKKPKGRFALTKKILKATQHAVAEAINFHKAMGVGIIVWSEKKTGRLKFLLQKLKRNGLKSSFKIFVLTLHR